jgi:hypothetical protein
MLREVVGFLADGSAMSTNGMVVDNFMDAAR